MSVTNVIIVIGVTNVIGVIGVTRDGIYPQKAHFLKRAWFYSKDKVSSFGLIQKKRKIKAWPRWLRIDIKWNQQVYTCCD